MLLSTTPRIFLISDLHIGHNKEFIYRPRGFETIIEHDNTIIQKWNDTVRDDDIVFILGDLMMDNKEYGTRQLDKLKGIIYFIAGNHDTDNKIKLYESIGIKFLGYAFILKHHKYRFYLSHYPTVTANTDDGKSVKKHLINLSGHTHSKDKFYNDNPFIYNVACDAHDCTPIEISTIIEDIKMKYNKSCRTCKYYCHEDIDDGYVCVNSDSEHCADWVESTNCCERWCENGRS